MNRVARQAARSRDIAAETESYIRTVLVGFVVDEMKQEPVLLNVGTSILTAKQPFNQCSVHTSYRLRCSSRETEREWVCVDGWVGVKAHHKVFVGW
jgi:hypothetical protein